MNDEIKQMILAKIDALHEKDNVRGIAKHRERLLNDLLGARRYELRNGKLSNHNGVPQNLTQDVELLVDSSSYIGMRADVKSAKYISKFLNPNQDVRKKMADETEKVLLKLSSINAIIPKDKDNYNRALSVLAKNFLYEMDEEGELKFAKLNDNGLTSEARFTFDEIKPTHLIDGFRTGFAQELKTAELKKMAYSIVGEIRGRKGANTTITQEGFEKEQMGPIEAKISAIRKNEILSTFQPKRLPHIPQSKILDEVMRKEAALRDMGALEVIRNAGGRNYLSLTKIAEREYQRLQDHTPIMEQVRTIQAAPAASYEGLSYDH